MLMKSGDPTAQLIYGPNDFRVMRPGNHVLCAVSGVPIPLEELRYWSVSHQEAYASADIASRRLTAR
ncbi:MAG: DUF2093 domain-containing protein [Tsuneonella suprasediminis]|uniref:DUF2093 domain-containing protein n=1 Tax=Tsuneonella suprasediminis TaxID=2306996 RepID=A0A419R418_9SPHN|nr:DUF2093 domain-containing protein [Tsuneonella suprasediminis]RJX69274.1 DUF2093 domain-containing protein [Tsuneonella suprasediminis]UBS33970.1 DUF2093 domain-containing protein [Altererythrobacter sp. N1]